MLEINAETLRKMKQKKNRLYHFANKNPTTAKHDAITIPKNIKGT